MYDANMHVREHACMFMHMWYDACMHVYVMLHVVVRCGMLDMIA